MKTLLFLIIVGPGIAFMFLFSFFFLFPLGILFSWMDGHDMPFSQAAEFAFECPISLWGCRP